MKLVPTVILSAFLLSACSKTITSKQYNAEEPSVTGEKSIHDVAAHNCEIFVDKAVVLEKATYSRTNTNKWMKLKFYLKLALDKLDADVEWVGFYGQRTMQLAKPSLRNKPKTEPWQFYNATPFLNANVKDFFEVEMMVKNDWAGQNRPEDTLLTTIEGSFYVTTAKGTTYWANKDEKSSNFKIDLDLAKHIQSTLSESHGVELVDVADDLVDLAKVPGTAKALPELNFKQCE